VKKTKKVMIFFLVVDLVHRTMTKTRVCDVTLAAIQQVQQAFQLDDK